MNEQKRQALEDALTQAYTRLTLDVSRVHAAQKQTADSRVALDLAKALAYTSGAITGKNEVERKASEQTVLATQLEAVRTAEDDESLQRMMLHISEIEAERVRWLIRLELGTTLTPDLTVTTDPVVVVKGSVEPDLPF
jgi:hypothetical protein